MFTKALLKATYKDGKPGRLTDAHNRAEHHPFKKEYLFKEKIIPRNVYVLRLIQHCCIMNAIENQLKNLSPEKKETIQPFFALTYLEQLWRTDPIQKDLIQLDVNPNCIEDTQIADQTKKYLGAIDTLSPKVLLAHFLLHVAGFMHGGKVIETKYIKPSNRLTDYQISTHQYNFEACDPDKSTLTLYEHMMKKVDEIPLDSEESPTLFAECESIYERMADIYDELCQKQAPAKPDFADNQGKVVQGAHSPKLWHYLAVPVGIGLALLTYLLTAFEENNLADTIDDSPWPSMDDSQWPSM